MSEKWGTACGVWGDIIVGLGLFLDRVGKGNILYLGNSDEIVEFLECQPFINKVKKLPLPEEEWKRYWIYTVFNYDWHKDPSYSIRPIDPFLRMGYRSSEVEITHLHYDVCKPDHPMYQWHGVKLPQHIEDWADEEAKKLPENFYLFQPYSFNSNSPHDHWPIWPELCNAITTRTNKKLVLIGHKWYPEIERRSSVMFKSPMIADYYSNVPSMMHIFALAKRSVGVITTSNSLAHWCQIADIPCTVICNRKSSRPDYIFRRVLVWPTLKLVNFDDDLETAYNAVGEGVFSAEKFI